MLSRSWSTISTPICCIIALSGSNLSERRSSSNSTSEFRTDVRNSKTGITTFLPTGYGIIFRTRIRLRVGFLRTYWNDLLSLLRTGSGDDFEFDFDFDFDFVSAPFRSVGQCSILFCSICSILMQCWWNTIFCLPINRQLFENKLQIFTGYSPTTYSRLIQHMVAARFNSPI